MRIICDNWTEALSYFLSPRTVLKLKQLGLAVAKMDYQSKTVIIRPIGEEDTLSYLRAVAEMTAANESLETLCSP